VIVISAYLNMIKTTLIIRLSIVRKSLSEIPLRHLIVELKQDSVRF
jgi:hypothetical protein